MSLETLKFLLRMFYVTRSSVIMIHALVQNFWREISVSIHIGKGLSSVVINLPG